MQTKFITKVFPEGQNRFAAQLMSPVDCVVIPCQQLPEGKVSLPKSFDKLDIALDGALSFAFASQDFTGKNAECLMINHQKSWLKSGIKAKRLLFVGMGDLSAEKTSEKKLTQFLKAARSAVRTLTSTQAESVLWLLDSAVDLKDKDFDADLIRHSILLIEEGVYRFGARFSEFKTKPVESPIKLRSVIFATSDKQEKKAKESVHQGAAIATGTSLTKDLGNLPPNICTPTYLAKTAQTLGKNYGFKVQVLERKDIEQLGMGAFLSVTKGTETPPKFIIMNYQGAGAKEAPIVLVGKGITFDTGGISLKPGEAMDEMKYDMCGAASVIGTMQSVALMKLKKNIIGVIPTCENMPSGTASRPGDIVTTMSGQTVEILNTDAEGRLILCDALTYVERFKPRAVIDVATLTGAVIIALGNVHSGLFSRHSELSEKLLHAGRVMQDTVWPMPLDDAYQEQLKSNFADMANIGGRPGGSITAACFLARYATSYPWAHIDIAGTAWKSGPAKGASGRPVPLLTEFLIKG